MYEVSVIHYLYSAREELFFGESDFANEVIYPTGTEPDLSQSWPAQLFENSQPLPSTDTGYGMLLLLTSVRILF